MAKQIEVVALEMGHDGVQVRNAGDRWFVPAETFVKAKDADGKDTGGSKHKDGTTWYVPVEEAPEPEPEAAKTSKRPPGAGPLKGSAT